MHAGIFPSSKAAKEQQEFSITLPDLNTFTWPTGEKQGIKVPMPSKSNKEQATDQGKKGCAHTILTTANK